MYYKKQLKTHEHWLPHVLATVNQPCSEFQRKRWCQEEINKIKYDEQQKTQEAKLKRVTKKKDRLISQQVDKKASVAGSSSNYESGGGTRAVTAARDRREEREARLQMEDNNFDTISSNPDSIAITTITWSKSDPRFKKMNPKQIKKYLENKLSDDDLRSLPATRRTGWVKEWRNALAKYVEAQPGETIEVPSAWQSTTQNPNRNPDTDAGTNGNITWSKTDSRLHALRKVQIRNYLVDKIPASDFDALIALGNGAGSLMKWRVAYIFSAK